MSRIRIQHKTLGDGRFHVITSPDVAGLHVTADTRQDAEREAMMVLSAIVSLQEGEQPESYLSAVEFQAA